MQYEDGTAGVGTRMWMRDRVMLTSIHMTFIWGFVPTSEIPSRPRENSLPNKGISYLDHPRQVRSLLRVQSSITDVARLPNIKHGRTATENNERNTHDAPDVFIDFYLVIRATGQAMITYFTDCRFRYAYMLHIFPPKNPWRYDSRPIPSHSHGRWLYKLQDLRLPLLCALVTCERLSMWSGYPLDIK
jgi:hypothetical protein